MQEHKKAIGFLLKALGLCLGWFVLYDIWLNAVDTWLSLRTVETSTALLRSAGYAVHTQNGQLMLDGEVLVYMMPACNGMVLMALFAGFILAFPGPAVKKVFFISGGIILIYLLNVLRVAGLALNVLYNASSVDFNHKYTFTVIVYAAIFGMWMLWVKRYAPTSASYVSKPFLGPTNA